MRRLIITLLGRAVDSPLAIIAVFTVVLYGLGALVKLLGGAP